MGVIHSEVYKTRFYEAAGNTTAFSGNCFFLKQNPSNHQPSCKIVLRILHHEASFISYYINKNLNVQIGKLKDFHIIKHFLTRMQHFKTIWLNFNFDKIKTNFNVLELLLKW